MREDVNIGIMIFLISVGGLGFHFGKNKAFADVSSCDAKTEWFSGRYLRCFLKNGTCSQYNHTDQHTCENSLDSTSCFWNPDHGGYCL
jgi:hypothetical protein